MALSEGPSFGWGAGPSASSATFTASSFNISTAETLVVVAIQTTGSTAFHPVTSVTATGLTFVQRSSAQADLNGTKHVLEVWWAVAQTALGNTAITVNVGGGSPATAINCVALGVLGADVTNPWDTNVSLPASANSTTGIPTVTAISTTYPNTMLFSAVAYRTPTEGAGSGYTLPSSNTFNSFSTFAVSDEYKIVTSAQSSVSAAFSTDNTTEWVMTSDAIRGAGPFSQNDWPNPTVVRPRSLDLLTWISGALSNPPVILPYSQYNWPNPRGAYRDANILSWSETPFIPMFPSPGQPFTTTNYDWPNPRGPAWGVHRFGWTYSAFVQTIPPPPLPPINSINYDWPNPRGPVWNVNVLNFVKSAFAPTISALAPPPLNYDWPNPGRPRSSIRLLDWLQNGISPIIPTLGDFVLRTAVVGRLPATDWRAAVASQSGVFSSRNLFPATAVPFSIDTYPVPKGAARSMDLLTWINPAIIRTQPILSLTTSTYDYQNPRGPVALQDLRTWIGQSLALNAVPAPPVVNAVFRQPLIVKIVAKDTGVAVNSQTYISFNPPLLTPTGASPFTQNDWPNPRPYTASIDLRTWVTRSNNLFAKPVAAQYDWSMPAAKAGVIDHKTWIYLANALNAPASGVPFSQTDWPVPKPPVATVSMRSWIYLANSINSPVSALPFSQSDWPVPKSAASSIDLRTWIVTSNALSAVPVPFSQTDWPNPRGSVPSVDLRTWIETLSLPLSAQPFFTINYDWPNPKGKIPANALLTWVTGVNALLIPASVMPPNGQADWPVPKGAARAIDLGTWIQQLANTLRPAAPLPPITTTNYDWPNPRGAARAVTLGTWIDQTKILFPQPIVPPTTRVDGSSGHRKPIIKKKTVGRMRRPGDLPDAYSRNAVFFGVEDDDVATGSATAPPPDLTPDVPEQEQQQPAPPTPDSNFMSSLQGAMGSAPRELTAKEDDEMAIKILLDEVQQEEKLVAQLLEEVRKYLASQG